MPSNAMTMLCCLIRDPVIRSNAITRESVKASWTSGSIFDWRILPGTKPYAGFLPAALTPRKAYRGQDGAR